MLKHMKKTAVILAVSLIAMLFGGGAEAPLSKVMASSIQEQLNQVQQEKDELEGKKDELQDNIEGMKGEKNTLQGELNQLNTQLTEISAHLEELEGKIADKEQEIVETQAALEEAKQTESRQYEDMVIRVRRMYVNNDASNLNTMINSVFDQGSFSDMLNTADNYEKIASYDKMKLDEFKNNRALIEEQEALLQQEKIELDGLKLEAETEKSKVSGLVSSTSNSIAGYTNQIAEAEAQAKAYEDEIKKKEEDVAYLKQKLAEELAMSQAAANGEWRDISEVTFADGDRYLLANLIYCEAGGEPYDGQVAVGAVVINRVLSNKFPDSVVGVIYQKRQFSPVASGRLDLALAANKATPRCYQAADEAMSGVTNVGNCVFFRTPVEGLEGINIGGHVFY